MLQSHDFHDLLTIAEHLIIRDLIGPGVQHSELEVH